MNWELILQTVVPVGAMFAWFYSRIDRRFDRIDERFIEIGRKLDDLNGRVSRIEGALWGTYDHKSTGSDKKDHK